MAVTAVGIKMGEELKEDGIMVNTLMITGAKMSKTALAKFKLFPWRVIAYVENIVLKPPTYMANHYFEMATSQKFRGVAGKVINGRGEIISSNPTKMGEMKGLIKGLIKGEYYPRYGENVEVQERLWQLCEAVCLGE